MTHLEITQTEMTPGRAGVISVQVPDLAAGRRGQGVSVFAFSGHCPHLWIPEPTSKRRQGAGQNAQGTGSIQIAVPARD